MSTLLDDFTATTEQHGDRLREAAGRRDGDDHAGGAVNGEF